MNLGKIGFGTYGLKDADTTREAIQFALENGYTHIDTATIYKNEEFVGQAIKDFNPNKFTLTTKVWTTDLSYDDVMRSFEESYKKLNGKIDILLIHWPHPEKLLDAYRALEKLKEDASVKEIGVSNFEIRHLELLKNKANIKPFLNQIEAHPKLAQNELRTYLSREDILLQSWSPIARGHYNNDKIIVDLAKKYKVTPNQIILNWHISRNYHPIPKSATPKHILENLQATDLKLDEFDLRIINSLDEGLRTGEHPELFDYK
ncbi:MULTISPECIES: aldo/keto reductase [unclassified Gemella]|uniref:aldo/keto reductase n=1 Tax=unclassified Gemella TaxID=2624949 RepID=UPI00107420CD|nr:MULTISPECIES: aldo/keto reductase [unclassified Gemella]MBF0709626.1 aldo/keto reductase [Gemella sp. GL1.1]MBF0746955.1 aldo/keto reductase [Gemella sp. 19428wG2_WT2a]NYS26970.1 aldo/keto reductase [Gemella sp. GL1]TFU59180.1 aldo/keto reductase [Gemella sp. WT2a]